MKRTSVMFKVGRFVFPFLFVLAVCTFSSCGSDDFKSSFDKESGSNPPSPGNNGILSAFYSDTNRFSVQWQKAGDDSTSFSNLQYKVFASSSVFSSYSDALSLADELTPGWTLDISSLQITIPAGRGYQWCNVFVRDENNNITAYAGVTPVLYNNTSPTPGGSGSLVLLRSRDSVNVSWQTAIASVSPRYRVYYSAADNISTYESAESSHNGIEITNGWTSGINQINVNLLTRAAVYYFNVFAIGEDDSAAAYLTSSIIFPPNGAPVLPDNSQITSALSTAFTASLGWTRSGDDYTPAEMLQYRVFFSTVNNGEIYADYFNASGSAIAYELTLGWTADISSAITPVLNRNITYYCNVFVRDGDGLISAYSTAEIAVPLSNIVPGNSGQLFLSTGISAATFTLSWTAATDDYTVQSKLLYRVFCATSSSSMLPDSLPATGFYVAEATVGWTENITTSLVPLYLPLAPSSVLYYNVYVKNFDGTIKAYSPVYNAAAPQPGNSGSITAVPKAAKKVELSWTAAADSVTAQSLLKYCIYSSEVSNLYTASDAVSTYSNAVAGASAVLPTAVLEMPWTADIIAYTPKMSKNVTYYFNVFVMDTDGNISPYVPVWALTGN